MNPTGKENKLAKVSDDTTVAKEIVHVVKQSKPLQKLIVIAVICLIFLIILLGVWIAGRRSADDKSEKEIAEISAKYEEKYQKLKNEYDTLVNTPAVSVSVTPKIVEDIISSQTKEVSELVSAEYLFTNADRFSDSQQIKSWNIPLTEKSFTIRYDGVIKAGIDLAKIKVEVNDITKTISLTVPRADFISYEIDNDSVEILDEKSNLFNKLTLKDKISFDVAVEAKIKERALDNGLLDKAQSNAENVLIGMLLTNPDIKSTYTIEVTVAAN